MRFVRFARDYNSCVLFGRCTQTSLLAHHSLLTAHRSRFCGHPSHWCHLRAIIKRRAVNEKTQCGALVKTIRCVSECNAVTLSRHRIGFSEQIYCMGRRRYTATAVEDILNGQRSTTAMGIEICFTHANRANPAKGLEQYFVRFA